VEGRTLHYVEGWFAIAQANAIFGFDGWDREMTHFERLYERNRNDSLSCGYLARVRIRVRAGDHTVMREGTGWGSASGPLPAEAHERALKAAETDATKRALATFGNRFGLSLYGKEQNGVTTKKMERPFFLYTPEGAVLAENLSAEAFCGGLRQLIEKVSSATELTNLARLNAGFVTRLRTEAPSLTTSRGLHYADVIEGLLKSREASLLTDAASPAQPLAPPSRIGRGEKIDKSILLVGTERRLRDPNHLDYVRSHACLICGRNPVHAHHLKFAQPKGLAMKVSDEFTVPLCAVHHDELHRAGVEIEWWQTRKLDPLPIAAELWSKSRLNAEPETGALVEQSHFNPGSAENDTPPASP
jgi:DNA recombination protein Rad52